MAPCRVVLSCKTAGNDLDNRLEGSYFFHSPAQEHRVNTRRVHQGTSSAQNHHLSHKGSCSRIFLTLTRQQISLYRDEARKKKSPPVPPKSLQAYFNHTLLCISKKHSNTISSPNTTSPPPVPPSPRTPRPSCTLYSSALRTLSSRWRPRSRSS